MEKRTQRTPYTKSGFLRGYPFIMRQHLILVCIALVLSHVSFAQSIDELEKRNGFKDIKLTYPVDSVKGLKLKKEIKERNQFPARLYAVEHPDYAKIGEVKVKEIELKAYKDIVYEIRVVADKDPRLMKALESIYGKADYDMKNETYFWKTENLSLKFRSHGKHNLELAYTSYIVHKMMMEDKSKKVDDIANDF